MVRRFGARLDQHRLGLDANAVIAWRVPPGRAGAVGAALAARSEVTHCYERRGVPGLWEHTLFAVVHAEDRVAVDRVVLLSSVEYMRRPAARLEVTP